MIKEPCINCGTTDWVAKNKEYCTSCERQWWECYTRMVSDKTNHLQAFADSILEEYGKVVEEEKPVVHFLVKASNEEEHLIYLLLRDHYGLKQNPVDYQNVGVFLGEKENPNMLSLTYCKYDEYVVCFYHGASIKVDYDKIDSYLKKKFTINPITSDQFVYKMLGRKGVNIVK